MDGFFQKVNEKVNLWRPKKPAGTDIAILKGRFLKKPVQKSILAAQAFVFRGDKYVTKKVIVVLHATYLLALTFASAKYYQNISNH